MNILLIGISGSGKDTQAQLLVDKYGFVDVGTGQLLRDRAKVGDELAHQIDMQMRHGFVSDQLAIDTLGEYLVKLAKSDGLIFNAAVRTNTEIPMFLALLAKLNIKLDYVVCIKLSADDAYERLINRGEKWHRIDDVPVSIRKRISAFIAEADKILEFFAAQGILIEVDGSKSVEQIHAEIVSKLHLK